MKRPSGRGRLASAQELLELRRRWASLRARRRESWPGPRRRGPIRPPPPASAPRPAPRPARRRRRRRRRCCRPSATLVGRHFPDPQVALSAWLRAGRPRAWQRPRPTLSPRPARQPRPIPAPRLGQLRRPPGSPPGATPPLRPGPIPRAPAPTTPAAPRVTITALRTPGPSGPGASRARARTAVSAPASALRPVRLASVSSSVSSSLRFGVTMSARPKIERSMPDGRGRVQDRGRAGGVAADQGLAHDVRAGPRCRPAARRRRGGPSRARQSRT